MRYKLRVAYILVVEFQLSVAHTFSVEFKSRVAYILVVEFKLRVADILVVKVLEFERFCKAVMCIHIYIVKVGESSRRTSQYFGDKGCSGGGISPDNLCSGDGSLNI